MASMSDAAASPVWYAHECGEQSPDTNASEQDRFLPIANISRIMKKALPADREITKNAKQMMQECVSEFISYITSEASDICQSEKREAINGDDLLCALEYLGFDPLKVYLTRYREMKGDTNGSTKDEDGWSISKDAAGAQSA